jgi:hypothetical protein
MRKSFLILFLVSICISSYAQEKKPDLANRAADHLMFQISSDHWIGLPDSISSHVKGLSRGLNVYAMLDKPFRGNPKLSIAFGVGVSSSNIFFDKMFVDLASTERTLPFINQNNTQHYKKFKVSTTFAEIPIEFRFSSKPSTPNKSIKFAIGIKGGTMLNAHNKAKGLRDSTGRSLNVATFKQNSKSYFNTTRLTSTARIGYGIFSLFGAYSISSMFKDGVAAPDVRNLQVGLTISGL